MFKDIVMINYSRPLAERKKSRRHVGPYRWNPTAPGKGRGFYCGNDETEMDSHGSTIRLRLAMANDHLQHFRLSYTRGYFCDQEGDGETLKPIIAILPRSRGFLAGWSMGAGMCAALDSYIWPTAQDAARAAHDMAERDAEDMRDATARELESEDCDSEFA